MVRCYESTAMPDHGLNWRQTASKRVLDLVVAVAGLLVTSPLVAVGWLAAALETRSNGFFRQIRIGRNGARFHVLKLRTMRLTNEPGTTVTREGDMRITRSGKVMRKLKVDELPQLVNVLVGQMSLVGPRPDVPGYADVLSGDDRIMLSVRPGITGPGALAYRHEERLLASVPDPETYNREVIWPDKVRLNCAYVRHWSMAGDFRYLLATVSSVFTRPLDERPNQEVGRA